MVAAQAPAEKASTTDTECKDVGGVAPIVDKRGVIDAVQVCQETGLDRKAKHRRPLERVQAGQDALPSGFVIICGRTVVDMMASRSQKSGPLVVLSPTLSPFECELAGLIFVN